MASMVDLSNISMGSGFSPVQKQIMQQRETQRLADQAKAEGNMDAYNNLMYGGAGGAGGSNQYMGGMEGFAGSINPKMPTAAGNRFEAGLTGAEGRVNALLDNPESIQQSAAYKFRLGQGQQALERSMSAKGMLASGNRLMDLTKYGQDMASQEYDNQFSRVNSLLGTYAGNWNTAQGTQTQQYLGELGTKRNALSDLITGSNQATDIANRNSLGNRELDLKYGGGFGGGFSARVV